MKLKGVLPERVVKVWGSGWRVYLQTEGFPSWKDALKEIPGRRWESSARMWSIPVDAIPAFMDVARRYGYRVVQKLDYPEPTSLNVDPKLSEYLFPYQKEHAEIALSRQRHIHANEMGTGKTAEIIAAICHLQPKKVLVVSPAIVRKKWMRELQEWYAPEGLTFSSIRAGRNRKKLTKEQAAAFDADVQFVSWALLGEVELVGWEVIVLDEVHQAKNKSTINHRAARELLRANPGAYVFAATGTPVADRPLDIWGQVELLWPGRLGTEYQFKKRYLKEIPCEWSASGFKFDGLRPDTWQELRTRVNQMMTRVTKNEIAHLIPDWDVQLLPLEVDTKKDFFSEPDPEAQEETAAGISKLKAPQIVEFVQGLLDQGVSHVCIGVKRLETAKFYSRVKWGPGLIPTRLITGTAQPDADKRNDALLEAAQLPRCVTVCTMDSVGIGINMTTYPVAVVAELDDKLVVLEQFLGRFSRVGGKVPSTVYLAVCEGTIDERKANNILDKVSQKVSVEKVATTTTKALEQTLENPDTIIESLERLKSKREKTEFDELLEIE